ncbi:hypothetical protein Tco_0643938 [Tanacetum coccineum]
MSWREFILALGLHSAEEMQNAAFGLYWAKIARRIPDKGDLSAYWIGISFVGDFLGIPLSYTLIMDPMLRLCHRLITCSIAGRSQAPKKVTMIDLIYLRGMDVGSVNVPYLLARYLRLFASGRKQGVMISGYQFVARLAEHFGLLTKERLQGLTVILRDLPIIDMAELVGGNAGGVAEEALVAPGRGNEDEGMPWVVPPPSRTQIMHDRIKTGSKLSTIVREYVTEPSRLSKSRSELRRESVYKSVKKAKEKDLAAKKLTKVVKYQSSGILCAL